MWEKSVNFVALLSKTRVMGNLQALQDATPYGRNPGDEPDQDRKAIMPEQTYFE